MLLIRRGQIDDAEQVLLEGLELTRSMPNPYEEGRTLAHLSTLHEKRGEHERARTCLAEALAIFRRLGARKDIERMVSSLQ